MSATRRQTNNRMFIIVLSVLTLVSFYLLSSVLAPFVAGALIAYLCDPLVNRLMKLGMRRIYAVLIVFLTAFLGTLALLLILIPLIERQVIALISQVPATISWVTIQTKWLLSYYNIIINPDDATLRKILSDYISKAGGFANWIVQTTLTSGKAIFETLVYVLLIPIVTFYLLRDWNQVLNTFEKILPKKIKPRIIEIAQECDEVIGAFFRGQLLVMLCLGIYYSIGLTALGLNVGVVVGLFIGAISIIPYLGSIVGVFIAAIMTYVQFNDFKHLMWLAVIFCIGHILENFVLSPWLIGNRVGLHPVAVIFAILAGGTLFGFFGVLLAIPGAAVIMILLRHLFKPYHMAVDNLG